VAFGCRTGATAAFGAGKRHLIASEHPEFLSWRQGAGWLPDCWGRRGCHFGMFFKTIRKIKRVAEDFSATLIFIYIDINSADATF
jgi:hypothetical protein